MQKSFAFTIVMLTLAADVSAQVRQFPYTARIVADETYVRSGGGEAFYPTQVLNKGTIVTVRRHDPGGWYMIDPPEGSFSWIPQKYVQKIAPDSGEVREASVVVFVGSSFGDETHVWQRKMLAGEKIEILGQKTLDTLSGPKQMLKIKPPKREYRWIPGSALIPEEENLRAQHDRNPYAVPSRIAKRQQDKQEPAAAEPKATMKSDDNEPSAFSPSNRLVRLKQIREEQRQLRAIDEKFRDMILSDPSQWKLEDIEAEYRELQDSATYKPVAGQIDLRYPAINRYRQRKAELDDLKRLTSATEKRDAELMAAQYGLPSSATASVIDSGTNLVQSGPIASPVPIPGTLPGPIALPVPEAGTQSPTGVTMLPPLSTSIMPDTAVAQAEESVLGESETPDLPLTIPSGNQFIGAGLLQRSTDDTTAPYLLTSPAGKVLAHVKANETVDLEKYVGRPVGLRGSRWYDESISSDYIEVSGLEPVRIRR